MKRVVALALVSGLVSGFSARAVDGSWGVDADGNWSGSGNWAGSIIATGAGARAYFTNSISLARTVSNDNANNTIGHLYFDTFPAAGWALNGQQLSLAVSAGSPTVSVANGSAVISARLSGSQGLVKAGAGTLTLSGNHMVTGFSPVVAGHLVVTGGAVNAGFSLQAGTMLSAEMGQGLVGEYYYVAPPNLNNANTNHASLVQLENYLATLSPNLLFNGPTSGTNFDFGTVGGGVNTNFPPGVPVVNFQTRWKGVFNAPVDGTYYFGLSSDDGSMVWIDGVAACTNNAFQGYGAAKPGFISLLTGPHEIVISYYEGTGGWGLSVDMALPGGTTNRLPLASLLTGPAVGSITTAVGSVLNLSNAPLTVAQSTTGNVDGVIVGSYPLRKIGSGRLALMADNSAFTGGFVLEGGSLSVNTANSLGSSAAPLTFAGGTMRIFGTAPTTIDDRPVNWGSFNGGFDIALTGVTFVVTNSIGGQGALFKHGLGTLQLGGVNSQSGLLSVVAGTLDVAPAGFVASTNIVVQPSATLVLNSSAAITPLALIYLSSSGTNYGRVYVTNGAAPSVAKLYINGVLQKTGTHGAAGSGAQFINDTYFGGAGVLTVLDGLMLQDSSWAVNANGDWGQPASWVNGQIAFGTNATAYFTNAITADRTVNNGYTPLEIGNLVFAPINTFNWFVTNGTMTLATTSGVAPSLTVSSNNATVGSTTLGSQGLLKTGAGQLILTGQGFYSGTTTVSQGALNITGSGTLYNAGSLPGAIEVAGGARLVLNRSDILGTHTNVPAPATTIQAGGLVFNTGAVFNTFNNLTLSGGELRANGGASAIFPAFQLKGTVTVSGASASLISATRTINAFNQFQIGNNQTNGTTGISVADVTGNASPDLIMSASFADGRNAASTAFVPSGFVKTGPGKVLMSGNNINTGPSSLTGGEIVVSGGVVNAAMSLANGTMVSAEVGQGIVGEFYFTGNGTNPLSASFNTPQNFANHLANVTPTMLGVYNGPNNSTNFDFTGGGWPVNVNTNQYYEGRWLGKFNAETNGIYSFFTASDDGSMIWIDGTNVVNNNFFQGTTTRGGPIGLAAGLHDIVIAYYQGGGGFSMDARILLPGSVVTNLLPLALLQTPPAIGALSGVAGAVVNVSNAPITIGQMSDGSYAGAFAGTNTVRKVGHGILTLTSDNASFSGRFELGGGRVAISSAGQLPLKPLFNGGVLRVTGTGITAPPAPHAINWSTFIGGFDVDDPANVFTITNNIGTPATLSGFWKFGPGELPVTGNSNVLHLGVTVFTGRLTLAQSHTTVNGGLNVGGGGLLMVTNSYVASLSNVTDSIGYSPFQDGAEFVLAGTSQFFKTQNNLIAGNAANAAGSIVVKDSAYLNSSGGSLFFGNGTAKGVLTLQDNGAIRTTGGSFMLANSVGSTGVFYQSGGTMALASDFNVGRNAGGYGFRNFTGGSVTNTGNSQIGAGGIGLSYQSGGLYAQLGSAIYIGNNVGGSGTGVLWVSGGTITSTPNIIIGQAVNGRAQFTLSGGSVWAANLQLNNSSNSLAIVNLNGGFLQAGSIYKAFHGGTNVLNLNGGTVQARANGYLFGSGGTNSPDNIYVRSGGVTLDSGISSTFIVPNLVAPPGSGLSAIPVATSGAGYIGAPFVQITDASGTGATAVAQVDLVAGTVTNIIVTSPGVNYSASPVLTLVGGGFVSAATLGSPTVAANTSGGVNIQGSGSVALLGTNTYAGATIISNGILLVNSTNAIGGTLIIATNTAGIGPTYPMDQAFIDWLTSKVSGASSGGVLALGTNSANNLNLTILTNWSLGAAAGSQTFSGSLNLPGTNVFLGGGNGDLIFQPNLVTGSNYFIGITGGNPLTVVTMAGTNDAYASGIIVQGGTLRAARTNSFGSAAATVTVQDGATLDVNGQNLNKVKVFVKGKGVSPNGAIVNSGASAVPALQFVTLTGDATFGGPTRWDIRDAAIGPRLDLAGFTMTKTNANELAVYNTEVTDGSIVVGQGIFRFELTSSATSGVGQITVGPSGTLDFWNFSGAVSRPVTLNGGIVSVGAGTAIVGSPFTLSGATNTFAPAAGTTLVPTNLISGVGMLQKLGLGTMKLPITESYTGRTVVSLGTLELAVNDPALGAISSSSGLLVNNGGTVQVDYDYGIFGTVPRPITVGTGGILTTSNGVSVHIQSPFTLAGGTLAGGSPDASLGNWNLSTNVTVTSASSISAQRTQLGVPGGVVFDVTNGANLSVSGRLEDPNLGIGATGTLIKAGLGTMTITSTNTYQGATIVAAGTLRLAAFAVAGGSAIWLDASDASTIARDANGFASQWSDKSGNARNATQAIQANKPVFVTNALLGKTVMRFGGSPQIMSADLSFLANSAYSIFAVEGRTNNGNVYFLGTQAGSLNNGLHFGYRNNTAFTLAQFSNDIDAAVPGYTSQEFHLWNGILDLISGHSLWRDGTNVASNTNTVPLTSAIGPGVIGCGFATQFFLGDLAEILIYNRSVSTIERQQVEGYLRSKWLGVPPAVTDLLPASSPLRLASGATFDLGGVNQTLGSLTDYGIGGGTVTNTIALGSTLTIGSDNTDTFFSGSIRDGAGSIALVKNGAGTQTLHGASTYTGGIMLNAGGLTINGLHTGTGQVLNIGGTLGGTGVIGGPVASVGTTAPGASPGTLTILGDYSESGTLEIELASATTHDRLTIGGAATLGGTLNVTTNGGYIPATGHTFTLLTASNGVTGTFGPVNLPALADPNLGWDLQYLPNSIVLSVTSAPTGYNAYSNLYVLVNGPEGDDDLDSFANLLEYVTGSNPTNSGSNSALSAARTNGLFALKFLRDTNTVDATLIVEGSYASTNNAAWIGFATNLAGSWGSSTNVIEGPGSPAAVTAFDVAPAATNRFLRLRITRP